MVFEAAGPSFIRTLLSLVDKTGVPPVRLAMHFKSSYQNVTRPVNLIALVNHSDSSMLG
jgi:hypothetical protein